jgi:hypothetical protein
MYSTSEVADALGISIKRLDNIMTGPGRLLVKPGQHGRSRAIPADVIERLALALLLGRDLGIPLIRAISVASQLTKDPAGSVPVGSLGRLSFDVTRLRSVLEHALTDVVENRVQPRRGRPPLESKKKRGASL